MKNRRYTKGSIYEKFLEGCQEDDTINSLSDD